MEISIPTVVCHYKQVPERKINIINQFQKHNITNYEFMEDFDGNEINGDQIIADGLYEFSPANWNNKVKLWGGYRYHPYRVLNKAELSITIKFGKILQKYANSDHEYLLLFEDDAILCDDFTEKFHSYLKETPDDWDAIYMGSGANLHPQSNTRGQVAYLKDHPASRCADSILLRTKTVKDLASTWFPFNLVSDWEFGYNHFLHKHRVYWWEPSLVSQGSENGKYKSTLR